MTRIEVARGVVLEWSRSVLSRQPAPTETLSTTANLSTDVATIFGDTGLVMTPAQAPAFFARSTSWRCTSCGKVHVFAERVSVSHASPCSCTGIEFDPQRELDFAGDSFAGLNRALGLLRTARERLGLDAANSALRPER